MQREKVRIYALARELDMESKDLLELCRQAGFDVKNQLSSLEPEQRDAIEQMARSGGEAVATAQAAPRVAPAAHPVHAGKLQDLSSRPRPLPSARTATTAPATPAPTTEDGAPAATRSPEKPSAPGAAAPAKPARPSVADTHAAPRSSEPGVSSTHPATPVVAPPQSAPGKPAEAHPPRTPHQLPAASDAAESPETPAASSTSGTRPLGQPTPLPNMGGVRNLGGSAPRPGGDSAGRTGRRPAPRPPTFRIAAPPTPKVKPPEPLKPQAPTAQKKIGDIPEELLSGKKPFDIKDIVAKPGSPTKISLTTAAPVIEDDEDDGKGKTKRPGGVTGRADRHKDRNARQQERKKKAELDVLKPGNIGVLEEDRPQRVPRAKLKIKRGTQPRKGRVPIDFPITVRSLSEAIGMPAAELLFKLMGHGVQGLTINSTLEEAVAETLALEKGCELEIKKGQDLEEELVTASQKADLPEELVPRAPVVTIMGHVDHGKTSLLDKIRASNVVATEAGGITQVIRAWRVEHGGRPLTFLDTPGHEAFTKMRARGANVTDIAVIVVAADDGVMPQTEEAINHAKAAGVSIVVAINKIDLPNANLRKTEQQLYGQGLIPDTMGGDVPFVQTSASTGKGIDTLLDMLSVVAELKELKANPNKPGVGTCLEASKSDEEGVQATLLVRDGTLRRGDVVLCGAAYGRVRAMYDDLGKPLNEAGPTVPVRITGLDEVPNADDPFLVVEDLATARDIADRRKGKQHDAALFRRGPARLETLTEAKIVELKIILKAEARGSIEAIRKELEKLHHDEVRVRLLHAAIGGITESDVQLALASPDDTIVFGFNVVPDDRARALAEERGVQMRQYNIIYQLTDDIRSALEGKLKPREDVIHLGRAVVRETFKISRTGTIAGCHVTQGTIERNAKVRVIRSGVVVYPPADRTVGLDSLKRFKEDVKEVREGFDCGLKVIGYDDIKVDDVIEAYRIEQVQRTLS